MLATPVAAAGATLAGLYYLRRGQAAGEAAPHFRRQHQAPTTWLEALYFLAETLRFTYGETLGRWKTGDLLIGLLYLARRETGAALFQEIRAAGDPLGLEGPLPERQALVEELVLVRRLVAYCRAMRERRAPAQLRVLARLGVAPEHVLFQANRAGVLRPSHCIVRDVPAQAIVLIVRGTTSLKDLFTSLTGASKPHHVVDGTGVVLGHCHFGILAAARWLLQERAGLLAQLLEENPGYRLILTGHSLGAGTAALLTMMLRAARPAFAQAVCYAVACPACATKELAVSCAPYVTSLINGTDLVPTISPGSADALREEVLLSSWSVTLRGELRRSAVFRVVEGALTRFGSAATAATSWTSASWASAATRMRACYTRPPGPLQRQALSEAAQRSASGSLKRSRSEGFGDAEAAALVQAMAASAGEPLSPPQDCMNSEEVLPVPQAQSDMEGGSEGEEDEGDSPALSAGEAEDADGPQEGPEGTGVKHIGREMRRCPSPLSGQPRRPSQLPEGLREGLEDVQAALEAEEAAEAVEGPPPVDAASKGEKGPAGRPAEAHSMPSTPSTQGAAQQQAQQAQQQQQQPRRFMYPLGRILHLVPVSDDAAAQEGASGEERQEAAGPARDQGPGGSCEGSDVEANAATAASPTALEGPGDGASSPEGSPEAAAAAERRAAAQAASLAHALALAGLDESLTLTGEDSPEGEPPRASAPAAPTRDYHIYRTRQEDYGRIRLCKTGLADHFAPAHLAHLDSALRILQQRLGRDAGEPPPAAAGEEPPLGAADKERPGSGSAAGHARDGVAVHASTA